MSDDAQRIWQDWLGRPTPPRDYYELLGVAASEADDAQIEAAATQLLQRLQAIDPGADRRRWQHLLDKIEAARLCLTDHEQRARYDQRQERVAAKGAAVTGAAQRLPKLTAAHLDPMAPVDLRQLQRPTPSHPQHIEASESSRHVADAALPNVTPTSARVARQKVLTAAGRRARRLSVRALYLFVGLSFLALVAGLYALLQRPPSGWTTADNGAVASSAPSATRTTIAPTTRPNRSLANVPDDPDQELADGAATVIETTPTTVPQIDATPTDTSASSPTTSSPLTSDRATNGSVVPSAAAVDVRPLSDAQQSQLRALLQPLVQLLRDANVSGAKSQLSAAERLVDATSAAPSVARFATLVDYVEQFWQAYDEGLRGLEGDEFTFGDRRVFVVEARPQRLTLRVDGRNRRFNGRQLPPRLALAVAGRGLSRQAASSPVFESAYLIVQTPMDRDAVLGRWETARRAGADLGDFPHILDDWQAFGLE